MKKLLFLSLSITFLFCLNNASAQQQGTYLVQNGLGPGGAPVVIELDNNNTLLVGYSSYGYDSSYVTMVWLDQNMAVTQHKEFRLTLPLNFVFHAVKCADEILIGTLEYSSFGTPISIIRTDLSGNVLRYDLSFNNPEFQEKIKQLVGNNNGSFTGYTSKSGYVESMYRIDGNLADTLYYTKKIEPLITNNYFRPFNTCDIDGNGLHFVTGGTNDFANLDVNAFIMKLDATSIHWCKSYNYGAPTNEEAYNIIKLANGNFAFVGQTYNMTTTFLQGIVTVTDPNGENVWTKKISIDGSGIYPSAIVQTASGDLLVFGNNTSYEGILIKFSSSGDLIWKKKWTNGAYTGFTGAIRQQNNQILAAGVSGGFLLTQLDEEGNGCQWTEDSMMEVSDVAPTVTDISFIYTPEVVSFSPYTVNPRELNTTSTAICTTSDIEVQKNTTPSNWITPNPANDMCYLSNASHELQVYAIYDVSGKKILDGQFRNQTMLSLTEIPHGIYYVRFFSNGGNEVVRLVH